MTCGRPGSPAALVSSDGALCCMELGMWATALAPPCTLSKGEGSICALSTWAPAQRPFRAVSADPLRIVLERSQAVRSSSLCQTNTVPPSWGIGRRRWVLSVPQGMHGRRGIMSCCWASAEASVCARMRMAWQPLGIERWANGCLWKAAGQAHTPEACMGAEVPKACCCCWA